MTNTVWIRNADWVVAWDASNRRHAYLEHGDVVFAGACHHVRGPGLRRAPPTRRSTAAA